MGNTATALNNLAMTHPELAREYNPGPNDLPADKILAGTMKKLPWKCLGCGHEWMATGNNRVRGRGCKKCAIKKRALADSTPTCEYSMAAAHPELAREYNPGPNDPPADKIYAGTMKELPWKCLKGHEWKATGNSRVKGSGCGKCARERIALARATPPYEKSMAITHPTLAKEYNPGPGDSPADKIYACTSKKLPWKCSKGHEWSAKGSNRVNGKGCGQCDRERKVFARSTTAHENSMAFTHPELAKEYFPGPNDLPAELIRARTNKVLPWRCMNGHEWKTTGKNRVRTKGCKRCAIDALALEFSTPSYENSMANTHPELANEYNPGPNDPPADKIYAGTGKVLPWKCSKCGHEWRVDGSHRARGSGCPLCNMWGIQGIRRDLQELACDERFRSAWEANIARLLLIFSHPIVYEQDRFQVNGKSYRPDFRMEFQLPFVSQIKPGDYLEVKGDPFKSATQSKIIESLNSTCSDFRIHVIDEKVYRRIEKEFSHLVPLWEKPGFNLRTHPEIFDPNYNAPRAA